MLLDQFLPALQERSCLKFHPETNTRGHYITFQAHKYMFLDRYLTSNFTILYLCYVFACILNSICWQVEYSDDEGNRDLCSSSKIKKFSRNSIVADYALAIDSSCFYLCCENPLSRFSIKFRRSGFFKCLRVHCCFFLE